MPQPTAAPSQPSMGRPAATKIGSASTRTTRSRYRSTRSGMGVPDAFKASVVKSWSGESVGRAATMRALYPGVEGYMFPGLCDYFVTVGSGVIPFTQGDRAYDRSVGRDHSAAWYWIGAALVAVGCALAGVHATLVADREDYDYWT